MKKLRIGLIGHGTIGKALEKMIKKDKNMELVFVFDKMPERSSIKSLKEGLKMGANLVIETASMQAVQEFAQLVLGFADLLVLSSSSFADKKFEKKIKTACKKNNSKVFVPSGAIIGLDGIHAAKNEITQTIIVSTKNPKSFERKDKKKTVLFEGNARTACRLFPKNVNVAATLALNSIGFDKTKVKIVSDPKANANRHEIQVTGKFGKFYIKVENTPSKNPKTSALAAKTTFELIKNIKEAQAIYS